MDRRGFLQSLAGGALAAAFPQLDAATYLPIKIASGGGSSPSASPSLLADWNARKNAAGVTFATDFSGAGDFVLASTNGGHIFAPGMNPTLLANVTKDTTEGLTNGCCLRITTPAAMGTNGASYMYPLNAAWTSNSQSFGLNTEWFISFRFKIPASRLVLTNCGGNQRGWKWMNLAQYSPTNTSAQSFSNTTAEIVMQDTNALGIPQMYHQDGASFPPFQGFAGGQITLQPAIDKGSGFSGGNRYCQYPGGTPACMYFPTDEWVTFKIRYKIGTYNGSTGNEMDMWMARWQDSSWTQLFAERNFTLGDPNSSGGGFTGLNGGHLLNYETNRINSTVDTYVLYDQLIVSTQDIALPQPLSPLGLLAYNMAPGTWADVAPSNQNAVLGVGGVSGSMAHYCNSMPWNSQAGCIEVVAMDHNYGRERYVRYLDATNSWSLIADDAGLGSSVQHGYDHNNVNPYTGDLFWRSCTTNTGTIHIFKKPLASTTTFTEQQSVASDIGAEQIAIGLCWWEGVFTGGSGSGAQGLLMFFNSGNAVGNSNDGQMGGYDPISNTWKWNAVGRTPNYGSGSTYHSLMEYSKKRNVAVAGGGNAAPSKIWRLNSDGTTTALTNVPSGKGLGVQQGIMCCDPVTGNFLLLSSSELWELDPTGSGTWTQQTGGRAPPSALGTPNGGSPDGNFCVSCPDYGVTLWIKQTSSTGGRMFAYKHA